MTSFCNSFYQTSWHTIPKHCLPYHTTEPLASKPPASAICRCHLILATYEILYLLYRSKRQKFRIRHIRSRKRSKGTDELGDYSRAGIVIFILAVYSALDQRLTYFFALLLICLNLQILAVYWQKTPFVLPVHFLLRPLQYLIQH